MRSAAVALRASQRHGGRVIPLRRVAASRAFRGPEAETLLSLFLLQLTSERFSLLAFLSHSHPAPLGAPTKYSVALKAPSVRPHIPRADKAESRSCGVHPLWDNMGD